jgi:metal-sulfur cluster biosynthetic enzyme
MEQTNYCAPPSADHKKYGPIGTLSKNVHAARRRGLFTFEIEQLDGGIRQSVVNVYLSLHFELKHRPLHMFRCARTCIASQLRHRWLHLDLGPRSPSEAQKSVTKALRSVLHPKLGQDIVYAGLLKNIEVHHDGIVSVTLGLDTEYRHLKQEITKVLSALPQVSAVRVHMDRPNAVVRFAVVILLSSSISH